MVGWKNSGKTTLAIRLIASLTARGYRVSSVKHAHHNFRIDDGTQDSARHRAAGARQVAVVSNERWALIRELDGAPEPDFDRVIAMLEPADVIVVEGYKSHPVPKIEARRREGGKGTALAGRDPNVIAIAADHEVEESFGLPVLSLDAIEDIANLVVEKLGLVIGRR
ncbi:MAG: molybdopterin-guanine dinucleotide biosynthesis protein B [Rhizobiales bacterium]|nr:molybdopterin-guanine dinucleotide biosynthesis protein B [Hyphomicrobiales bacterium]